MPIGISIVMMFPWTIEMLFVINVEILFFASNSQIQLKVEFSSKMHLKFAQM